MIWNHGSYQMDLGIKIKSFTQKKMISTFKMTHVLMILKWFQWNFLIFLENGTGTDDLFFEILKIYNKRFRRPLSVTKEINDSKGKLSKLNK